MLSYSLSLGYELFPSQKASTRVAEARSHSTGLTPGAVPPPITPGSDKILLLPHVRIVEME